MDEFDWFLDHLQSLAMVALGLMFAVYANYALFSLVRVAFSDW